MVDAASQRESKAIEELNEKNKLIEEMRLKMMSLEGQNSVLQQLNRE